MPSGRDASDFGIDSWCRQAIGRCQMHSDEDAGFLSQALKLIEGIARNAQQQPHSEVVAAAANAAAATGVIDRTPLESVLPPLP